MTIPDFIKDTITKIKNATFGGEIQDTISEGITKIAQLASEAENHTNEIKEEWEKVNKEWESNPNKDPEIVAARGNEPQLRNRFENVDRQLAQTAYKTGVLEKEKANKDDVIEKDRTVNERIDNLLINGGQDSSAEVIDGRLDKRGIAHDLIGNRIDADIEYIENKQYEHASDVLKHRKIFVSGIAPQSGTDGDIWLKINYSLNRDSEGLLLRKDFDDGTLNPYTGNGAEVINKALLVNNGSAETLLNHSGFKAIQFDFSLQSVDSSMYVHFIDNVDQSNRYRVLVTSSNISVQRQSVAGGLINLQVKNRVITPTQTYAMSFSWIDNTLKVYIDGILEVVVEDDVHSNLPLQRFSASAGSGVVFDNVVITKGDTVTVRNLPKGHKISVGGREAEEFNGVAILNAEGMNFPQKTINIMDISGNISNAFDPVGGIYSGDIYSLDFEGVIS